MVRALLAPLTSVLCCFAGCSPEIGDAQNVESADAGSVEEDCPEGDGVLFYADEDGDGFGDASSATEACEKPVGLVDNGDDCDDLSALVNPQAIEVCGDNIDNNCTGSDPCQDAILAHWNFEDASANDVSGNGRDVTLANGSQGTSEAAIRFDGLDDYAEAPHDAAFALENGTLSFWALSNTTLVRQGLWSKDASGFATGGHLQIEFRNDDTVRVRLQSPTASMTVSSVPLPRDAWHHIAFTFGVKGMKLYIDGALAAFDPYAGGIENNSEPIVIGSNTNDSEPGLVTPLLAPLSGEMADVRMYSRALTDEEIGDIFAIDAR